MPPVARRIKAFLANSDRNLIQNGQRSLRQQAEVMRAEPQVSLSGTLLRFKIGNICERPEYTRYSLAFLLFEYQQSGKGCGFRSSFWNFSPSYDSGASAVILEQLLEEATSGFEIT